MKYIELTQGMRAIVDDEDYEELSKYKWYYKLYAVRSGWVTGKRTTIRMHRQIMSAKPGQEVDHRNGHRLDNRKVNLRVCSKNQNQWNRKRQGGSSEHKGVYWNKRNKRWRAQIQMNGQYIYLGEFKEEIQAAEAYSLAATKLFGEYART